MKPTGPDPLEPLRLTDPLRSELPDDPSSTTAARVLQRALEPEPSTSRRPVPARRFRAGRALPALALAAAIIAVVGLSLPKGTPDPVRATLGAESAAAQANRALLLQAAEHREESAEDEDARIRADEEKFLSELTPYPQDPTPERVLAWLDANCVEVSEPGGGIGTSSTDCGLDASLTVIGRAPARVAADVLRAWATLDVDEPTHASLCPDWESVDPAWRAEVERAEAGRVWVTRNNTRIEMWWHPAEGFDPPLDPLDGPALDLEHRSFSAVGMTLDSPPQVFVQCRPTKELGAHPEQTAVGAMEAYAAEHGYRCNLQPEEEAGLIAFDLATACGDFDGPLPKHGVTAEGDPDAETPTTAVADPTDVTTTSTGGSSDVTSTSMGD